MNLFETAELARIEHFVDTETGEVDLPSLQSAQIALKDKRIAVTCFLRNSDANIELIDNAIKSLQARKKAMQSSFEGLSDYLLREMQLHNISEINAPDLSFSAKIKLNPASVVVDDATLIPSDYMSVPVMPAPAPDKMLIKAAIKDGYTVAGCHLEQKQSLKIK